MHAPTTNYRTVQETAKKSQYNGNNGSEGWSDVQHQPTRFEKGSPITIQVEEVELLLGRNNNQMLINSENYNKVTFQYKAGNDPSYIHHIHFH